MWHLGFFGPRPRTFTALICVLMVAACGDSASTSSVDALAIALTRVGPNAIQVDWSDDPNVSSFTVSRDGFTLATVASTTLIDTSVIVDQSYCYQVSGFDPSGMFVAASDTASVTVFP